jgi:hypothetical protein
MAILGSLVLVFATLVSLYLAFAWGEMAGIPQGGDKTSLGGLFVIPLFMGMRWLALAIVLALGVSLGSFEWLAGSRTAQYLAVVGLHLLLGAISLAAFNWIANGLTRDVMGPQRWCWFFGVVLPLPAFAASVWGLYRTWLPRHLIAAALLALGLLLVHLLPYVNHARDMRRTAERLRQMREQER